MVEKILFIIFGFFAVVGALGAISRKNVVHALLMLVFTFLNVAAIFFLTQAYFLAVVQVLVYAGAIMVLFVFVVMMVNREESTPIARQGLVTRAVGVLAAGYVFYRAAWLVAHERAMPLLAASATPPVKDFGTVSSVGALLFSDFLFPFEAISLLLLVAVIGGVMLTRHAREDGPRVS